MEPELYDPPDFSVTTASLNGSIIIAVRGEIDMTTAPQLEEALVACNHHQPVVVDLRELDFIDSSGLHVLLQNRPNGRPTALVVEAKSNVARVLDIVAASNTVFLCHDVETAMRGSDQTES